VSVHSHGGLLLVATGPATSTAHTVSAWSLLAQLVIGMAVILCIILVATRFLRGKGRRLVGPGRKGMLISVVARQSMGKGVSVVIVQAGTESYLLGVTQHQVTRLDQLDPESLVEGMTTDPSRSTPEVSSRLIGDPAEPSSAWGSFVQRLQDRSVRR
jgi:flagellar biogenesis protein FliO